MKNYYLLLALVLLSLASCNSKKTDQLDASHLHDWNVAYESGIINDFFSPPVAGRMYTYPNLIVYAILSDYENETIPLLTDFPSLPKVETENKQLVSLYAFYFVGKKMIYSYNYLDDHLKVFEETMSELGYSDDEMEAAKNKAQEISGLFLEWVSKDGYKETRSDTKFSLSKKPGAWKPTPPDFMDALEPNWHKIRTSFLDSPSQFTATYAPYPYDMTEGADFHRELKEVKDQVDETTEEQLATAKYWDCNPLAPQHKSHATYAEKKLTPGGHWISIGRNVSKQNKDDIKQASRMYTLLALSINDGFIACWQAKYHYDYIRPVTAIQENWDTEWMTLILTPNFPEYPSGHSVISGTASTVLAGIYGDQTKFTDNAEEPFGMQPRTFNSLTEACDQAAMSRFWAGIHYKKAILDGVLMGRDIGNLIIEKTKLNAE